MLYFVDHIFIINHSNNITIYTKQSIYMTSHSIIYTLNGGVNNFYMGNDKKEKNQSICDNIIIYV